MYKVGIGIIKFYHQSWYLELDKNDIDKTLAFLMDGYEKNMPSSFERIGDRKSIVFDGAKAIMEEISFFSKVMGFKIRVYQIYAMKDDVIVNIMFEAPEAEFETYRQIFDESIKTARVFYPDSKVGDNEMLDREIDQLIINVTKESGGVLTKKALNLMHDVKAMSPSYATTRYIMGGFWLHYAAGLKGKDKEYKGTFLQESEKELRLALELYNKYPQDYLDIIRETYISQCYYLLGDMYYFMYSKKDEAKVFFEESLKHFDNPLTKDALKKYSEQ